MNKALEEAVRLNSTYGWNIIPMYFFKRNADGTKKHKLIDWQEYKSIPYNLKEWSDDYNNLAVITGKISDLSILDIDSEEAKLSIEKELNCSILDISEYVVKTTKGYQLFYKYQPNSKTRIGLKDKIDFLNGGISFALPINEGYTVLKDSCPDNMPDSLKVLLINDEEHDDVAKEFEAILRENSDFPYRNPLIFLVDEFLESTRLSKKLKDKLEQVFCTKDYKTYRMGDFARSGQKHTSILYVGGIISSNPTIGKDKVIAFMERWSTWIAKIDLTDEHEQSLFRNRVKAVMNYFRYDEDWKQKNKELSSLEHQQISFDFKAWYNPEDDCYYFYDLQSKIIDRFSRPSFKEHVAHFLYKGGQETSPTDIDTSRIDRIRETFDPTVDDEFFTDERGVGYHNNFKRSTLLQHFIECEPTTELPYMIGNLLRHLIPVDEERQIFLHSLAYHMTYLQPAPTCYIFTSIQGTGKNTLLEVILGNIYEDAFYRTEEASFGAKFRDQLKNRLCVFVDELKPGNTTNADRGGTYNVTKQQVGNRTMILEGKGKDEKTYPNHALYVMASNEEIPMRITDESDRRINVIKPLSVKLENNTWYPSEISKDEFDKILTNELKEFVSYLASIQLDHKKWTKIIDNDARRMLLKDGVPAVNRYTNAIIKHDIEALMELNHDFGEWFEREIIKNNRSYISTKELKEHTGDLSVKIGKRLRDQEVVYKVKKEGSQTLRVFVINPEATENLDFDKLKEEF